MPRESIPLPPLPKGAVMATDMWREHMEYLEKMGSGPRPDWQGEWQWSMPQAHTCFINMIGRAYQYAPYAQTASRDELEGYLGFAEVAFFQIYTHHHLEEEIIYPQFKEASGLDVWERNIVQHTTFEPQLDAAWVYIRRCRQALKPKQASTVPEPPTEIKARQSDYPTIADPEPVFDSTIFQTHMDTFLEPLIRHLCAEIETLHPDIYVKVGKKMHDKVLKETTDAHLRNDPRWYLISVIAMYDMKVINQLIPVPWFVKYLLVPLVWAPKYSGWWSYTMYPDNVTFWGMIRANRIANRQQREEDLARKQK